MKTPVKYLLVVLVAAAVGCAKKNDGENIEKKIEAAADACKDTSKCSIDIKDVAKFEWDHMFVFNSPQPKSVIEAAIGTAYPNYEEGMRPMIFLKGGNIVHSENNPDGMLKGTPGQIIFSYKVGLSYWVIVPTNTVFGVKVAQTKGKTFYELFATK